MPTNKDHTITNCVFCDFENNVEKSRHVHDYLYWRLVLQHPEKLQSTKQAAGLLITKRHIAELSDASDEEMIELRSIIKDASRRLCEHVGTRYADQETLGFNQGKDAGQTVFHAHIHVLPVSEEDPEVLKKRFGVGAAFEALRRERLSDIKTPIKP